MLRFLYSFVLAILAFANVAWANTDSAIIGAAKPWQTDLQAPVTPVAARLAEFHNEILLTIIIGICIFVLVLMLYVIFRFGEKKNPTPSKVTHNTVIEVIWTVVPIVLLVIIAIPSFQILYYMEKTEKTDITLKITGFQWAWEYNYPDHDLTFESYMVPEKDLTKGQLRLLSTDNPVVLPVNKNIRLIMTARDVIHSWAMPSWGVKKDTIPGRLNETWARVEREGVYFGQCSELCGTNHAYMPAEVWVVPEPLFNQWIALARTNIEEAKKFLIANWPLAPGYSAETAKLNR